jgi:hypothetical protein
MGALVAVLALAAASLVLTPGSAAAAQATAATRDVRISIDARGVPLGKLLHDFAALAHVEQMAIDPRVERIPVTVKIENEPAAEAFRAALRAAGVDFAIWGEEASDLRIVARAPENSATATVAAAKPVEAVKEKRGKDSMEAVLALAQEAAAGQDPAEVSSPEIPEAHADPLSAFLNSQLTGTPATSGEAVTSPAQAAPFIPSTPSTADAGKAGAAEAAAPANVPDDPFARYLSIMAAKKPPKQ